MIAISLLKSILIFTVILVTQSLVGEDKKLLIATTSQFPPYTISYQDKTGIDPELISTILERAGYDTEFLPTPSTRQIRFNAKDEVDAVTGWEKEFLPGCHVAKPYRYWFNALITPLDSTIDSIDDLSGKRLAIFESAEKYVDGLSEIVEDLSFLVETHSSLQAGRMVKSNRVDAYVGDYVAYYYSLKANFGEEEAQRLTDIKHYFNRNPQKICFKDKAILDKFEIALDELIDEQIYVRIYSKYSPGISPDVFPTKSR